MCRSLSGYLSADTSIECKLIHLFNEDVQTDKNIFSQDQISVLEQLMDKADDEQKKVLDQMLREYGSNKYSPAV